VHPGTPETVAVVLVPAAAAAALRRPTFAFQYQVDWLLFPHRNRLVARGRGARYLSVPAYVHAPGAGEAPWPLRFHLEGEALPGEGALRFEIAGGFVRFEHEDGPALALPLERLGPEGLAEAWPGFVLGHPVRAAAPVGKAA